MLDVVDGNRVVDDNRHVMIGSERPIDFNMDNVINRLLDRHTRAYLADAQWDADAVVELFRKREVVVWRLSGDERAANVNTDLFPKDEFNFNQHKIDVHWRSNHF